MYASCPIRQSAPKGGKKTRVEYCMWDEANTQLNMSSMAWQFAECESPSIHMFRSFLIEPIYT
jgi:hypothetical protein